VIEPTIDEAQAALDELRASVAIPFSQVKAVETIAAGGVAFYHVRFWHGPALTVPWLPEESFRQATLKTLRRYFQSDGHELLADHQGH